MMYEFQDTVERPIEDEGYLPTSAMSYNGQYLERLVEGYRTLNVTGREMISLNIASDAVRVGTKISEQRVQPRILTIQYILEDKDPEELQNKFKKLMMLLYQEDDVEITFNDDPQVFYYGRYSEADEVPGDTNSIVSSFTVYCQDPRKYSKTKTMGDIITVDSPLPTTPERIEVVMTQDSSLSITNTNTGIGIGITGAAIYRGNTVIFDFDDGTVYVNDTDSTSIVDLNSGFENFIIRRGDTLTCVGGTMTVYAREVRL